MGGWVFAVIGANFDEYHADPSEYADEGDRVVVKGQFRGKSKSKSGALLDTGFTHIFDTRDGKVVRFENEPDDAQAWAAGWTCCSGAPEVPRPGSSDSGRRPSTLLTGSPAIEGREVLLGAGPTAPIADVLG